MKTSKTLLVTCLLSSFLLAACPSYKPEKGNHYQDANDTAKKGTDSLQKTGQKQQPDSTARN